MSNQFWGTRGRGFESRHSDHSLQHARRRWCHFFIGAVDALAAIEPRREGHSVLEASAIRGRELVVGVGHRRTIAEAALGCGEMTLTYHFCKVPSIHITFMHFIAIRVRVTTVSSLGSGCSTATALGPTGAVVAHRRRVPWRNCNSNRISFRGERGGAFALSGSESRTWPPSFLETIAPRSGGLRGAKVRIH